MTHRDPVPVTASMVTMLAYSARMAHDRVDLDRMGSYWSDRLERMLRSCVADRDALPADRSIDVRFDEFMADDMAMVAHVYEIAGQPMADDARRSMAAFMAAHPRGRHGTVHYDLADFGLDAGERRPRPRLLFGPVQGHTRGRGSGAGAESGEEPDVARGSCHTDAAAGVLRCGAVEQRHLGLIQLQFGRRAVLLEV